MTRKPAAARSQPSFVLVAVLENGTEVTLGRPERDLARLARRFAREAPRFSESWGVDYWTLEDNSLGRGWYTATLAGHLRALRLDGAIDAATYRTLADLAAGM